MSLALTHGACAQVLGGGRVLTPDGVRTDAWVHIDGETIRAVAAKRPDVEAPLVDLEGAWLLPGYVDLHMHGGGGHSVTGSLADMDGAVAFHRSRGTTSTLVSLMTAPVPDLYEQLGWAAQLTRRGPSPRGHVLGSHLEGPFLSPRRCGAQNPEHMRAPDPELLRDLLDAAEGTLRMMTLAPELDGALALIGHLRDRGVIAALGHSDASYAEALDAIRAGANHATHLFNAMPPLHHRAPGLAGAALQAGISCELINDGHHVHPALIALTQRLVDHPILVTDAIEASGVGDTTFVLAGQEVQVSDGEARLVRTGSLAGSTLTMDQALRRAVLASGLSLEQASAAASAHPARALGLDTAMGSIAAGLRADLVVLDDDLEVAAVMAAGVWHA